jgi:pimeloyl-ACP methyl ester carboxylesterase
VTDAPVNEVWSHASGDDASPVLVLVHGSMDRSAGLLRLSRRLRSRFRVVRYDRRGYGRSLGVGPPYRVADHVDDLAEVIERTAAPRGAGPVSVFGHSFGGNVALALACERPDLVAAVATYESPMSWLDWWPDTSAGGAALSAADAEDAAEAFMRAILGERKWERVPQRTREARRAEGPAMVAELADLRGAAPWDAGRIAAPVLAMYGERARSYQRRAMCEIARTVADGGAVEIAGAGHVGPNTHSTDVAAELVTFLPGHRAD